MQTSKDRVYGCSPKGGADITNATIIKWIEIHAGLAIIRIAPDSGFVPEFEPGQFITIGLPRDHPPICDTKQYPEHDPRWKKLCRRAYSIASSTHSREHLDLFINIVEDGNLTPKLWEIKEQGRLWMDGKIKGDFTLKQIPANKDLVMIATGTGIAPYISMLQSYRTSRCWRHFVIVHGCRVKEDLGYQRDLERIVASDNSVTYIPMLTREPLQSNWHGLRGRVPTILNKSKYRSIAGNDLDPKTCHVFLCGNPGMIGQVETQLMELGFTSHSRKLPGNIHFERYW